MFLCKKKYYYCEFKFKCRLYKVVNCCYVLEEEEVIFYIGLKMLNSIIN